MQIIGSGHSAARGSSSDPSQRHDFRGRRWLYFISLTVFIDFVWRLAAEQTWTVRTRPDRLPASGHRGARGAEPPPRCISSQLLSI